jgi:mono/diheme cytochrome c family protein
MARRFHNIARLVLALVASGFGLVVSDVMAQQPSAAPVVSYAAQGWSDADRNTFYTTSQGSHMMPYAWFKALRRVDVDQSFAADQLRRYGYLPSSASASNPEGLPVGFVIDGMSGQIGMTCAACHTAQLEYTKDGATHALRLDGAPANADFQQFLADLVAASRATLTQPDRFDTFAKAVLGSGFTAAKAGQLKDGFAKWTAQFGEFMDKSLPALPWGPGRLDAFGMIFNRVAARDLGVANNFRVANAPVSYPFLWNASLQDRTQWNGGVPNGLYIQALGRNTGEVFGVFADFTPKRLAPPLLLPAVIDYSHNSASFAGLQTLEEKIVSLRSPPWPREIFGLNDGLVEVGKPLFEKNCAECHGVQVSPDLPWLWRTPVKAVGTDPKMADNSVLKSDAGLLTGALMPPPAIGARIPKQAKTADLLANVVVGSLIAEAIIPPIPSPAKLVQSGVFRAIRKDFTEHLPDENLDALLDPKLSNPARAAAMIRIGAFINARLSNMFTPPANVSGPAYESRVLTGIWATAPFLHNGSVPNLWELLMPPKDRKTAFMVGSRVFDPIKVGYATDETPFKNGAFAADPANANGNGNGGHDFGTTLSEEERWAIIEYLKTF